MMKQKFLGHANEHNGLKANITLGGELVIHNNEMNVLFFDEAKTLELFKLMQTYYNVGIIG
jgi:prepilin-type processing-associated H-X9-DG protein